MKPEHEIQPIEKDELVPKTAGELQTISAAAAVKARIEASYLVAHTKERDIDKVRTRLLADCRRYGFADAAWYEKPVGQGKKVPGLSIRFAEAAFVAMGNLDCEIQIVHDDDDKRICSVRLTDLETNAASSKAITIEKVVERKRTKDGQVVLGTRTNSYGDLVFLVRPTADELEIKTNALVSKAKRNEVLAMIPADVKDDCIAQIKATIVESDRRDPALARKRVLDAFAKRSIEPDQIKRFLGHSIEESTPEEILQLRAMLVAIQEGEANWSSLVEAACEDKPNAETRTEATKQILRGKVEEIKRSQKPAQEPGE